MVSQQNSQRMGWSHVNHTGWMILIYQPGFTENTGDSSIIHYLLGGNLSCDITTIHPEIVSHHIHIHQCHRFFQNHHGISGISIWFSHTKVLRSNLPTPPKSRVFFHSPQAGNAFPDFRVVTFFFASQQSTEVRSTSMLRWWWATWIGESHQKHPKTAIFWLWIFSMANLSHWWDQSRSTKNSTKSKVILETHMIERQDQHHAGAFQPRTKVPEHH